MNNVKLTETIVKAVEEVLAEQFKFVINNEMEDYIFDKVLKIINEQVN